MYANLEFGALGAVRGDGPPPQREIDAPPFRQQGRGPRDDAVDAVKGEPRLAGEHHGVPGGKAQTAGRLAALRPSDPEQAGIAEGKRDHGRPQVALVPILMPAPLSRWSV